ncbi:MAG: hypothetical protein ACREFS_13230 [Acetobacteraceae bacterium]
MPRLEEIRANLASRLQEARDQGWLGEVAAIETTLAAAAQKLKAMQEPAARSATVNLGMPEVRGAAGRSAHLPERSPPPAPGGHDGHRHVAPLKDRAPA